MGTHAFYGFKFRNIYFMFDCHHDGYFDCLGKCIIAFIIKIFKSGDLDKLKEHLKNITVMKFPNLAFKINWDTQIKYNNDLSLETYNYNNLDEDAQYEYKCYEDVLHDISGDLDAIMLYNIIDFNNVYFTFPSIKEWNYVIDLDDNTFVINNLDNKYTYSLHKISLINNINDFILPIK